MAQITVQCSSGDEVPGRTKPDGPPLTLDASNLDSYAQHMYVHLSPDRLRTTDVAAEAEDRAASVIAAGSEQEVRKGSTAVHGAGGNAAHATAAGVGAMADKMKSRRTVVSATGGISNRNLRRVGSNVSKASRASRVGNGHSEDGRISEGAPAAVQAEVTRPYTIVRVDLAAGMQPWTSLTWRLLDGLARCDSGSAGGVGMLDTFRSAIGARAAAPHFEGASLQDLIGSLATPTASTLSLCVRRIDGGLASSYLHEIAHAELGEHAAVKLGGPYGAGMSIPDHALRATSVQGGGAASGPGGDDASDRASAAGTNVIGVVAAGTGVLPVLDFATQLVLSSALDEEELDQLLRLVRQDDSSSPPGSGGVLLAASDISPLPGVAAASNPTKGSTGGGLDRQRIISAGVDGPAGPSPSGKYAVATALEGSGTDNDKHFARAREAIIKVLTVPAAIRERARNLVGSSMCMRICLLAASETDAVAVHWLRKMALIAEALQAARSILRKLAGSTGPWGVPAAPRLQLWINYKQAPTGIGSLGAIGEDAPVSGTTGAGSAVLCGIRPESWSEGRFGRDALEAFLMHRVLRRGAMVAGTLTDALPIRVWAGPQDERSSSTGGSRGHNAAAGASVAKGVRDWNASVHGRNASVGAGGSQEQGMR